MKMIKFKDLQSRINDLSDEYQIALQNKDENKMYLIQQEYEQLRDKLCTYRDNLKKKSAYRIKKQNQREDISEAQKEKNDRILKVKAIYEGNKINKQYINIVGKSSDIRDFYKRKNQKKVNFVKRHFDKIALGAALVFLGTTLISCGKNSNTKEDPKENVVTEQTIDENSNTQVTPSSVNEDNKLVIEDNTKKDNNVVTSNLIKLNPLPIYEDETIIGNKKADEEYKDGKKTENGVKINYNNEAFKKKETVEEMDPHVSNDDSGKKTTITVKEEKEVKEKEPVDYDTKTTDNTKTNKKEKTTITTKEEKKDVTTTNLPIEGATEEEPVEYKPTEPEKEKEEKVVYEEKEEKEEVNTKNIEIEETTQSTPEKEPEKETPKEEIKEEKVVYEEKEEKQKINYDIPVDETSAKEETSAKVLSYTMRG